MIKIKEELFVDKKKHHLEFVYVSIDSVSGIIFYDFVANSVRRFFFQRPLNTDKPNFVSFLVFVGAAASITAKISSFETVAKRGHFESCPKTVNFQGYFELQKPIRTRENCYPLIL